MQSISQKAILVVSFGTSYANARTAAIESIENELAAAFPEHHIYRAWTSQMIIRKLKRQDQLVIPTVTEAVQQMIRDGIRELIVQPTHVINGIENDIMKEDILSFKDRFASITFSTPLLTSQADCAAVISALVDEFQPDEKTALVLMGHGTGHHANTVYAALDYACKDTGHTNIFIGTVEAYPTIDSVLRQLKTFRPRKILLAPLMIVAGDHARNDMAGDEPDSWKSLLKKEGYEVQTVLKGLGEYPAIRSLFLSHTTEAAKVSVV